MADERVPEQEIRPQARIVRRVIAGVLFAITAASIALFAAGERDERDERQVEVRRDRTPPTDPMVYDAGRSAPPSAAERSIAPRAEETPAPSPSSQEPRGLDLFRPGMKPIKIGIVVPADFALPPGYLRHVQVTDDGAILEPILMYDADHPPKDDNGRPIAVTADRIVPVESAPKGMPIRMLVPPSVDSNR